jgi:hypothetical protein
MAHDHRMNPIADPYINQRNKRKMEVVEDYPGLTGRSNMQADTEYDSDGYPNDATTDQDLMPEGSTFNSTLPINPAIRAFQESGHGVQIISPMAMQPKKKKGQ